MFFLYCLLEMEAAYPVFLSLLSPIGFWVNSWLWLNVSCIEHWVKFHSQQFSDISNYKELLSKNPVLPWDDYNQEMLRFLNLLWSYFTKLELDLAVSCYHDISVLLCHKLMLERDRVFLSVGCVNNACGICTGVSGGP